MNILIDFLKVVRGLAQVARRQRAKFALTEFISAEDRTLRAVGLALRELLSDTLSPAEACYISRIENRRGQLLSSDDRIAVVDYGAGSPDAKRTKEEMSAGIQSTQLVSNICSASKPAFWATFLFKLIRHLKPSSCLELGTCVGISAAYQAAALEINGKGRLLTLEGSAAIADVAKHTLADLGLANAKVLTGPFDETLKMALEAAAPIDYFFNDGHHDHDAVLRYFNQVIPYLSDGALVILDDISWSSGMRKAWVEIEEGDRVSLTIDFGVMGLAVVASDVTPKRKLLMRL